MGAVLLLVAALAAAPPAAESATANTKEAPRTRRVIDRTYTPQVGDKAFVDTGMRDEEGDPYGVPACPSVANLITYAQLTAANNEAALDKMEDAKTLILLDAGDEVLVTAISPIEVARIQLPQGVVKGGPMCAEIQVLSGEDKGKTLYTLANGVVRYAEVPEQSAEPAAPAKNAKRGKKKPRVANKGAAVAKAPPNPGARAASLWKLGQNLEKAGKTEGAVTFYRQLVKEYPDAAEAKLAAARIKALGK